MTFCLAMKVEEGLVAIADTRVTSGTEHSTARKLSVHHTGRHAMFLMTSGLRSVRDKAVTYFNEVIESADADFDRLYKAVNAFGQQVRRVAREDKESLVEAGLAFNLYAIVGGQFENDKEHTLYLIYPEGNWIEISRGTPYCIIGETSYGKPLLDRALRYESSLEQAIKIGYVAFDATRTSATDVDFPLDMVMYKRGYYRMYEHRYERTDLLPVSEWWNGKIRGLVRDLPSEWVKTALVEMKLRCGDDAIASPGRTS
ncbi:MAG: peptidase [Phycisphaeraceae bacterium]|nr:peptidase [Phycisphaeraceae bacterium]